MDISLFVMPFAPLMQVAARELIFSEIWISLGWQHQITHTHTESGVQGAALPCNVLYGDTFGEGSGLLASPVVEGGGDGALVRSEDRGARALLWLRAWKEGTTVSPCKHLHHCYLPWWRHKNDPDSEIRCLFLSRIIPRGCQQLGTAVRREDHWLLCGTPCTGLEIPRWDLQLQKRMWETEFNVLINNNFDK